MTAQPRIVDFTPDAMPELEKAWNEVLDKAPFSTMAYADYRNAADERDQFLYLYPTPDGGEIVLPFIREWRKHKFKIGERQLGTMKIRTLRLVCPWMADGHPPELVAEVLQALMKNSKVDTMVFGEIPEDSNLRAALELTRKPLRVLANNRESSLHWLADLPETFDAYMLTLSSKSRQSLKRKIRKLEKDFDTELEILTKPEDVDRFVREAHAISRLTYQWHAGNRLLDDEPTRKYYRLFAERGHMRCYLLWLDGKVQAFLRGYIEGRRFVFETPGFNPEYGNTSIGSVLLLYAKRDLIENTDCTIFDYGWGGDRVGYKSTFGSRNFSCNHYSLVNPTRPRAAIAWSAQSGLNGVKNLANRLIKNENIRQAIKRRLRRYST